MIQSGTAAEGEGASTPQGNKRPRDDGSDSDEETDTDGIVCIDSESE